MRHASWLLPALLFTACGGSGGSPDAAPPDAAPPDAAPPDAAVHRGAAIFEAAHYDVVLDLATSRATVTVTLAITAPGDCVTIGFRPESADSVSLDGAPATDVSIADGTLTACDGARAGWPAGATVPLEVVATVPARTWGASQVGYSTSLDAEGQPFTYLVSWVGGCDRHGPCDARPHLFPTYRFTVDHDAATRVLCPGVVSTPMSTRTICEFTYAGGPTYSTFGLMAGRSWTPTSLGTWAGGVAVTLYDTPSTGIRTAFDVDALSGQFAWMHETFGAYPYGDELRFVVGPTYWAGFEHPGNISLSEDLAVGASSYADGLTHVTMHEIAHQWAGDHTTLADTYDFVWKEAMAEYLTFVYEDEHLPPGVALKTAKAWKNWSLYAVYFPVPEDQPRPALLSFYGDVYGPGPMVLFRQLERMYDRTAVIDALKALINTSAPRAISVEDVRLALEATTGADLSTYFDAWVYGSGRPRWPRVAVTTTDQGDGTYTVAVNVTTQDGQPRGCKFTVQLTGPGGATYDVPVDLGPNGQPFTPVTVAPGFTPTGHVLDPYAECLIYYASATAPEPDESRRVEPWRAPRRP